MELILLSASACVALLIAELADHIAAAGRGMHETAPTAGFAPHAHTVSSAPDINRERETSSEQKSELDQAA